MEWPQKSGKKKQFPEVDKADWFNFEDAKKNCKRSSPIAGRIKQKNL